MATYLAKYRPLISTPEGKAAAQRHRILPFVDGSCRREPDFEHDFPSISALCRAELFAPRLQVGDEVVYITTKDFWGEAFSHRRIVARLRIFKRFSSHADAAHWYRTQSKPLPSNCMVSNNPALPLSYTSRGASNCAPSCGAQAASLAKWNAHYQRRADSIPVFLVCECIWKNLRSPAIVTDQAALRILGTWERVRSRLPITIGPAELLQLERL